MKGEMSKKGLYAGTGAGLILFVLVGMFPGSLIGGAVGLFISKLISGGPVEPTILPRIILVVSMLAGVAVTAGIFIIGTSVLGWAVGSALDTLKAAREGVPQEAAFEKNRS